MLVDWSSSLLGGEENQSDVNGSFTKTLQMNSLPILDRITNHIACNAHVLCTIWLTGIDWKEHLNFIESLKYVLTICTYHCILN